MIKDRTRRQRIITVLQKPSKTNLINYQSNQKAQQLTSQNENNMMIFQKQIKQGLSSLSIKNNYQQDVFDYPKQKINQISVIQLHSNKQSTVQTNLCLENYEMLLLTQLQINPIQVTEKTYSKPNFKHIKRRNAVFLSNDLNYKKLFHTSIPIELKEEKDYQNSQFQDLSFKKTNNQFEKKKKYNQINQYKSMQFHESSTK